MWKCFDVSQVPDSVVETDEKIDAVVLDEEAVGPPDGNGSGAKILRGEDALEMYLDNNKSSSKVIKHDYPYIVANMLSLKLLFLHSWLIWPVSLPQLR